MTKLQRLLMATGGLAILALGISLTIAVKGPDPWGLFIVGLMEHLPFSLGVTSQLAGLALIVFNYVWGKRKPGLGTIMSMVLVGLYIDLYNWLLPLEAITDFALRIFLFFGIVAVALGISIYVRAGLGEGPVEGMMFVLSNKLKLKVGPAKILQDFSFLGLSLILGVIPQWGTVVTALSVGPLTQIFLQRFSRKEKGAQ